MIERLGLRALHCLDPETAHGLALKALGAGLAGGTGPVTSPRLETSVAGIALPNPVGVAAGFDKNATVVDATLRTGFGFCEIGAATPYLQTGNPRPRLFRLTRDRAAINRFGFNNLGMDAIHANLTRQRRPGIVGVNLGANKETEDKAADYCAVLGCFYRSVSFATLNVSSPNTERLRDLQGKAALNALLERVLAARDALAEKTGKRLPVFLKIAPDLTAGEVSDIVQVCLDNKIDGITATNTTIDRSGLRSPSASESGGLSGAPLFDRSTRIVADLYRLTGGALPLIGVGGIGSAEQAYAKVRAGASAVQLYTALVYNGISLGARIAAELDTLLHRDGLANIADAVGLDNHLYPKAWEPT